jgi:hypothetical protein
VLGSPGTASVASRLQRSNGSKAYGDRKQTLVAGVHQPGRLRAGTGSKAKMRGPPSARDVDRHLLPVV